MLTDQQMTPNHKVLLTPAAYGYKENVTSRNAAVPFGASLSTITEWCHLSSTLSLFGGLDFFVLLTKKFRTEFNCRSFSDFLHSYRLPCVDVYISGASPVESEFVDFGHYAGICDLVFAPGLQEHFPLAERVKFAVTDDPVVFLRALSVSCRGLSGFSLAAYKLEEARIMGQ